MAKRIENECAYCAKEVETEKCIVGDDWKVYCSHSCASAGEGVSREEIERLLGIAWANRAHSGSAKML